MYRATALLILLAGCGSGGTPVKETVAGRAPYGTVWTLEAMSDAPFPGLVTLQFHTDGTVSGVAPCNSYSSRQSAPAPWFELGKFDKTDNICADIKLEQLYLINLRRMDFAEVTGNTMLLSADTGETLLFRRLPG